MMAGGGVRFLVLILVVAICGAASVFQPISDSHRSAALDVFVPVDGSYKSLEEAYEALKTLEILGIEKKSDLSSATCEYVVKVLGSSSSTLKDAFYALNVNGILKCKIGEAGPKDIVSQLQAGVKDAKLLLDFYYSVRGLVLVKEQFPGTDISLGDAEAIFRSIKALSQSDGRWRYSSNNPESSTFAAGLAYETLAGVISLAPSELDPSLIQTLKKGIVKLFDSIQKFGMHDGTFYFDEKSVDASQGPISTTASVIRGLTSFAASESTGLNLPGDKIVGLAKFFLGVGIPGDAKDFFNQIDALACLEDNKFSVPLILSLPSTVISLTKKEPLKVKVSTVLGSKAPALSVKLTQALSSKSVDSSVINNQELKFDADSATYFLDSFPKNFDVGKYTFVFEILLDDSAHEKVYITEAQTKVPIAATGVISIENAEIAVLDSDIGSVESQKKLDLTKDGAVSLSANHLQKLRLSFQLTTPIGNAFKPHQAFFKLKHESQVEHIYLVKTSGKKAELVLDFLGLVEKLYYLSGKYEIQLTIGDASMENSLLSNIGHIELDLPERPEKAPRPPQQSTEPYSRYGPKAEISHIFRIPEKLPAKQLSLVFLGVIVLPFIGFLIGLTRLGVNIKSFPSSTGSAISALLFHGGIGAVLLLYVLFWLKLDLFTTLKALSLLGVFLLFVGHRTLSQLAAASNKLKSA
ncbi:ribophorin II family protein [Arabidopsis lyrata subsp. lyrata]|uniref:Dolichyl-diphosphooligosaccharide--protein glycosyltransferase subunit 2 n=1 Tax=Arabidopsis lyrata subsp. lyrata TaxID=81972 RepID=D7MFE7_ARALL|nr:ribophorin II family protein [Arabidopsis lyrata subsp. lyrata]